MRAEAASRRAACQFSVLVRALGNLIRNALAYAGSHGPIRIRGGPQLDRFRLIVQDTGPGLAGTDLESVFAPFY